jgi:hypothetical protein
VLWLASFGYARPNSLNLPFFVMRCRGLFPCALLRLLCFIDVSTDWERPKETSAITTDSEFRVIFFTSGVLAEPTEKHLGSKKPGLRHSMPHRRPTYTDAPTRPSRKLARAAS